MAIHSTSRFADPTIGALSLKVANVSGEPEGSRTPSLRNVDLTSPYGHGGAFETLDQAIDAHAGILPKHAAPDAQDKHDIIEFLQSLSGRPPQPPRNYWPGGE
jgi:cytochrome c peroxidase